MQIVGKPEKPKSREPLILLGLWLITQVLLPSGPYVARLAGSSPVTRTIAQSLMYQGFGHFLLSKEKQSQQKSRCIT